MATQRGLRDRATLLAFLGVAVFGGLNTIAVKLTVAELAPLWGMGTRFAAAGLIFAGLTMATGRHFPSGSALVGAIVYGAVGYAAAFGLIYPALRQVPAGTGGVVIALAPLATYTLAVAQRQERFQALAVAGGLVALAGVAIVFIDQLAAAVPLVALALAVGGLLCLCEASVIAKWIPRSDPIATNAVAMLTAGILGIAASLTLGEPMTIPGRPETWVAVSYIVVFGSVVLFGLYLFGIERWTASGMSYSSLLLPFVSVTAATLIAGESFSLAFVVGGAVMVVGVYVGAFLAHRPNRSTGTAMPECLPIDDGRAATQPTLRSADGTRP